MLGKCRPHATKKKSNCEIIQILLRLRFNVSIPAFGIIRTFIRLSNSAFNLFAYFGSSEHSNHVPSRSRCMRVEMCRAAMRYVCFVLLCVYILLLITWRRGYREIINNTSLRGHIVYPPSLIPGNKTRSHIITSVPF